MEWMRGKPVLGRKRSGISPVVATVILVAITIVIALAFSFWVSGLLTAFQQTERLEVRAITANNTNILIRIRNVGSNAVTIDSITVTQAGTVVTGITNIPSLPRTIAPGGIADQNIRRTAPGFTPGSSYDVTVITSSGNTYPVTVFIPG
ncbi:MAG: hypothetical protein NXY59_07955 [Aigarchaeota archaeon]|nr:hypothetical protein [Candidatus Pelearchaeum maunauluense]